MKVLFVSPEVSPFSRTGGLGEVVGSLPVALSKIGIDTRILCPFYKETLDLPIKKLNRSITFESQNQKITSEIGILKEELFPIPVYFLINTELFGRNGIYADTNGDYPDNWLRACVLSHAAVCIEKVIEWSPQIIHAHDWMAAPACAFLNAKIKSSGKPLKQSSVLTIHNLEHQGIFSEKFFGKTGLPREFWGIDGFEHQGSLNLLKGGIQHASKLTTVSPSYSSEIKTEKYGHGLDLSLKFRAADLIGILNGIDEESWNPMQDLAIPSFINPKSPKTGKKICKEHLIREMGLHTDKNLPLFGVVSRLYHQKGLDLLASSLKELLKSKEAQFVILGSGDIHLENIFLALAQEFHGLIGVRIGFDDKLARKIFAGTDFFIMPSRFEPCGLAQQYAMKYGSIPIARNTGGLSDTITPRNRGHLKANGYLFKEEKAESLLQKIKLAIKDWNQGHVYLTMQKNALMKDCSWGNAAKKYSQVYEWSLENR